MMLAKPAPWLTCHWKPVTPALGTAVKVWPSCAVPVMVADIPNATVAVVVTIALAVPGLSSANVTVTVLAPTVAYVCEPATWKLPALPETVPPVVTPSPQSMVANRSLAAVIKSVSVNEATTMLFSACPVFALNVVPVPANTSCSATAAR